MTSLAYGLDMPYEVQLEHHAATSTTIMVILESQRSPGQLATRHLLTPGVYMVSLAYNGAAAATLQHVGGGTTNKVAVPAGTAGTPRISAPIKISVQGTTEYLQVVAPSTGGSARATISVIPASTFDEMAESAQGVSVLSDISNLKTTLDARVPADTSLRLDTSVGTRIFAGNTMIHGDTGWREISGSLMHPNFGLWGLATEAGTNTFLRLNRVGSTVTLDARISPSEDLIGTRRGDTVLVSNSIPSGFRPHRDYILIGEYWSYTSGDRGLIRGHTASIELRGADGVWLSNELIIIHASWETTNSWPATLPGLPS